MPSGWEVRLGDFLIAGDHDTRVMPGKPSKPASKLRMRSIAVLFHYRDVERVPRRQIS
jgi:hypothetical protein